MLGLEQFLGVLAPGSPHKNELPEAQRREGATDWGADEHWGGELGVDDVPTVCTGPCGPLLVSEITPAWSGSPLHPQTLLFSKLLCLDFEISLSYFVNIQLLCQDTW